MPALRPEAVDVVRERLHVREAGVRVDPARGVALRSLEVRLLRPRLHRPAVVDVDVLVAVVGEAARDDRVGGLPHDPVGDVVLPHVPAVPAHVRGQRQRVADHDPERALRRAVAVRGRQGDGVRARGRHRPADPAVGRVEPKAGGKALGREAHRPLAGRGDREEEGRSGPRAEHPRAVDARGRAGPRREDRRLPPPRRPTLRPEARRTRTSGRAWRASSERAASAAAARPFYGRGPLRGSPSIRTRIRPGGSNMTLRVAPPFCLSSSPPRPSLPPARRAS